MPSNWIVFDRIRALAKSRGIFQHERVYQDQSRLDHIAAGGELLGPGSQQAAILDQTNLQLHRLERYKDYEQMDQTGEIQLALDLYADEASLVDPERKHTLIIRAHSRRLKRELEELFFNTLQWDTQCRPSSRYLCKFGDCPFEIVLNKNRTGVSAIKHMNVYNFTRIETRYGDLVGFFYQDEMLTHPVFLHPWQVMHLRLTSFENIYHPYGRAVIDGGRKAFKQLRLMEDAALIYRITRAPERLKFTVPVGDIPPKEVPEYIQMIARTFKRQRFYNPATGTFDERYSPLIQEDNFYLPRRSDGVGPDIDVLPGAENLDQIADIEYFKKKMIAPTKIPFSRVGIGEGSGEGNEKSLSQSSSEFAKAVQWVQREMVTGLTKIAIVHLALRGYRLEDIKGFELAMSATSAMEELYRIETWQTRVGVMLELKEIGWFPKEWIITHFTDLTPDEIEELKEMEAIAAAGGDGNLAGDKEGEGGGGGLGGLGGGSPLGGDDSPEIDVPVGDDDVLAGDDKPEISAEEPEEPELGEWNESEQRRVLVELRSAAKSNNRAMLMEHVRRLHRRLGKDSSRRRPICNQLKYQMENHEFDGLRGSGPGDLLVECSVPSEDRESAIEEVRQLLVCESAAKVDVDAELIVEGDLPSIEATA